MCSGEPYTPVFRLRISLLEGCPHFKSIQIWYYFGDSNSALFRCPCLRVSRGSGCPGVPLCVLGNVHVHTCTPAYMMYTSLIHIQPAYTMSTSFIHRLKQNYDLLRRRFHQQRDNKDAMQHKLRRLEMTKNKLDTELNSLKPQIKTLQAEKANKLRWGVGGGGG